MIKTELFVCTTMISYSELKVKCISIAYIYNATSQLCSNNSRKLRAVSLNGVNATLVNCLDAFSCIPRSYYVSISIINTTQN